MEEKIPVQTEETIQQTKYVSFKEQMAFNFSAFFRDMSYAIMGQVNYFYMDVLGLEGFKLAFLMGAQKVWDGINDPLMGAYFDRRAYTSEKARRYFKTTGIPVALLLLLMFLPLRFSASENLNGWLCVAFIFLCYMPFEAMHTVNGTAFMSYYNSITPNIQERNGIISRSRLFSNMGTAVASAGGIISILQGFIGKDDVRAKGFIWSGTALMIALAFVIYNILMYTQVKERIVSPPQSQQKIFGILRALLHNKLFLLMILSNTIGGLINAGNTSMYFFDYNLGNTVWQTVLGLAGLPGLLLSSWLAPKLSERFEKRNIVLVCALGTILISSLYLVVGYESKLFIAFIGFLSAIPSSIRGMLYWSMIADSVDYLEYKTGKRNDGSIYAVEGLMGKLIGGIGAASTAIILKAIKFQRNALAQSPETMRGLFVLPQAIGIIGTAAGVIPYFFYDLTKKDHAKIMEELKERAEAKADL